MNRTWKMVNGNRMILPVILMFWMGLSILGCGTKKVRVAQFNIYEMSTLKIIDVDSTGRGRNEQLKAAAEIIRRINPDILLINEIDHDMEAVYAGEDLSLNVQRFLETYLDKGNGAFLYPYIYMAPCNTGFLSGKDLDNNGKIATVEDQFSRDHGGDCFGYGEYPGQYSMAIVSRFPFQIDKARTFQYFLWKDYPDNLIPDNWYSEDEIAIFRLSSKSHWDVPVQIGKKVIHLLAAHPTPAGYDGPEDRNGRRNYDEIGMWAHYLDNDSVLVDDKGQRGGLAENESFIVMGDMNASPQGDMVAAGKRSIDQLLNHPRIHDCGALLTSRGALKGRNPGPPEYCERHTTEWREESSRIDHLLPSKDLKPIRGGVFWPDASEDPQGAALAKKASDHRMIWLDLE